eukprot:6473510-Amphidinium_carterae.2
MDMDYKISSTIRTQLRPLNKQQCKRFLEANQPKHVKVTRAVKYNTTERIGWSRCQFQKTFSDDIVIAMRDKT